jgi:electron-transferring-flavoprotein dehydrogenase
MTSVALTGTNHAEDQPIHLRVVRTDEFMRESEAGEGEEATGLKDGAKVADKVKQRRREHVKINVDEYAGLLGRACPAGVYEYVDAEV